MPENNKQEILENLKKVQINEKKITTAIAIVIILLILMNANRIIPRNTETGPDRTIDISHFGEECIDEVELGEKTLLVEIADEREEQIEGLMFRKFLPEDYGMLFIFEKPFKYSFWMKNTLIPLDIIFISEDKKVIEVFEADPCTTEQCLVYQTSGNAKYVLEVNQGFSKANAVSAGSPIKINLCK